jgi:hypothetical protein
MYSITLQTTDNIITSGDRVGQIQFAASNESDGSAAISVAGSVYCQAEGSFQSASNPTSLVLATAAADASAAVGRIKVTDNGNILPMSDDSYDLGNSNLQFKNQYISEGVVLSSNTPSSTTNKLYNEGGTLKFNGSAVGGGSSYTAGSGLTLVGTEFNTAGSGNFEEISFPQSVLIGKDVQANGSLYPFGITTNVVIGYQAGSGAINTGGVTAIGQESNTLGIGNRYSVFIGDLSAYDSQDHLFCVAIGRSSLYSSSGCDRSVVIGPSAGQYATTLNDSVALGYQSADYANGRYNIAIGKNSLIFATGDSNIEIVTNGSISNVIGTNDNKIHIENTIIGDTSSKLLAIGNVSSSDLTPDATLEIKPNAATDTGLIVQGATSQSATLQEWQNSSETKLLAVGPDGGLEIPSNTPSTTTNKLYNDGSNLNFGTKVIIDSTNVNTGLQYQPLGGGLNVTGLTTTEFAAATLVTESDAISSNDNDTTIPTSAAVKDYVDGQGFLTSETSHADVVVDGDFGSQGIMLRGVSAGSYSILTDNSSNWNTAYGWGDHGSQCYATLASPTFTGTPAAPTAASGTNTTQIATTAYVTTAIDNLVGGAPGVLDTLNELAAAINDDASYASTITTALATKLENIVEDTTPQLGGTLDANGNTIDMGTYVITDAKVGQWDTAYGWGDHSSAGYLTSQTSHADVVVDGDFGSQGIMLRGASAGTYSILTDNSANWNTAYGWGDHATAGYITATLTQEQVEDYAGNLISTGGTKTGITVTYQDSTNDVDFVVGGLTTTEFAAATLVTSAEGISSNNNDTTIPTSAAVKAYADSVGGGGGGTPGGSDTQIQFNDGGSFGGDADLVWNKTTNALTITGSLNATTKSFLIDHPSKPGMKLQYASLEGPENGVYVRGTTDKSFITLPDYWRDLVHNDSITVTLTPIGQFQPLFVEQKNNREIFVGGVCGHYDYVVWGERKDVDKLEVEW